MGFQVGKKQLFNNCFHICIHCNTCLVRYCKDNKGSIPQSSTTPFFQNLSAKALHVSKPQDTECVGKPDTKSPPIQVVTITIFYISGKDKGLEKTGVSLTLFFCQLDITKSFPFPDNKNKLEKKQVTLSLEKKSTKNISKV